MSQDIAMCEHERWYHWWRFPLLPRIRIKKANEWNTSGFHFDWLVFRAWSMDNVQIQVEAALDDQQLVLRAMVPYFIFGIFIPVFPQKWTQKLWRKPPAYKRLLQTNAQQNNVSEAKDARDQ